MWVIHPKQQPQVGDLWTIKWIGSPGFVAIASSFVVSA
jgi:hypothetical protein